MIKYDASPTMAKFHNSPSFVRSLFGPIGSGKSVACVIEMLRISFTVQEPEFTDPKFPNGVRKSRWVVVRNTYRELIDTTIQTFFDWYPESAGKYHKQDMKFTTVQRLPDGTSAHVEFLFRALDKPDDIKKLLSLEVTGGWLNEAREIPKAIMDMLIGRLGRYPRKIEGQGGATRHCLIMDTNPPDSDHWYHRVFEVEKPEGYEIFYQPSGLSEKAENIRNLPTNYYQNMMAGKDQEWINVYVHGQYGFVQNGKPVWQEYKDDIHHTDSEIVLHPTWQIYIGIDFGLTPAAVFGVRTPSDQIIVIDELVSTDMDAKTFGRLLKQKLMAEYPNYTFSVCGDPAGDQRAQSDSSTPFMMLQSSGISAYPAWTNDPVIRIGAVAQPMKRLDSAGNPGFLIGPKAPIIRKACAGGYKYKRLQVTGEERFTDVPDKNRYSHPADALQYMMLAMGEGTALISSADSNTKLDYKHANSGVV
jgi:hypothetical protein